MTIEFSNVIRAENDRDHLETRYQRCKGRCNDLLTQISDFENIIDQRKSVSINLDIHALSSLLIKGMPYAVIHDFDRGDLILNINREDLAKRIGKDAFAFGAHGVKMCFGALNLGNTGVPSYGNVCVILRNDPDVIPASIPPDERDEFQRRVRELVLITTFLEKDSLVSFSTCCFIIIS